MIPRKLYGVFFRVLILVSSLIVLTIYWRTHYEYHSKQLNPHELTLEGNYIPEQDLSHSESSISKRQIPWYFKDGTLMPNKAKVNPKTGKRLSRLWPEEQNDSDRVEEQLMFVPPHYKYNNEPMKKILLYSGTGDWNIKYGQDELLYKKCPVNRCIITKDRGEASDADAILFRNHYHELQNVNKKQVRIMYYLESPYHTGHLRSHTDSINWTSTYRHDSDIVAPYEKWAYYDPLVTKVEKLHRNYAENKTKKVAMFVSNCITRNNRLAYANELAKYISVDIYGVCGKLVCPKINKEKCFRMLNEDYKFYLSFENSNCIDYVTEKFFVNGLQHDVLPIVMGGRREDYLRMAPDRSYVHVDDFESPRKLAEYLHRLDADDALYNEYFRWKGTGEFIDTRFFCRLCALLHDDAAPIKNYGDFECWWSDPTVCNETAFDFGTADSSSTGS